MSAEAEEGPEVEVVVGDTVVVEDTRKYTLLVVNCLKTIKISKKKIQIQIQVRQQIS